MNYRLFIILIFGLNAASLMGQRAGWNQLTADFMMNLTRYTYADSTGIDSQTSFAEKAAFLVGWQRVFQKKETLEWHFGAKFGISQFEGSCDCSRWPSEHDPSNPGGYLRDPALDDQFKEPVFHLEIPASGRFLMTTGRRKPFLEAGLNPVFSFSKDRIFKKSGSLPTSLQSRFNLVAKAGVGLKWNSRFSTSLFLKPFLVPFKFNSLAGGSYAFSARRTSFGLETTFRL